MQGVNEVCQPEPIDQHWACNLRIHKERAMAEQMMIRLAEKNNCKITTNGKLIKSG